MWVVTTALNNAISPIVEYDVLLQGRCMFFLQKPQPALLHIKCSAILMNGMTATLPFHTKKHKTIHYTTIIPMLRDFPNRCSYVWWSNRWNIAKEKQKKKHTSSSLARSTSTLLWMELWNFWWPMSCCSTAAGSSPQEAVSIRRWKSKHGQKHVFY